MPWAAAAAVVGAGISAKGQKDAAKAAKEGQQDAAGIIAQQAEEAKKMIFQTIPVAERNLALGQQAGLNVLGQAVAPQMQLARGGNIAAQETLLAGLPQQQAALLGRQVDLSALQPYAGAEAPAIDYQLPQFESAITPEMLQQGVEEEEQAQQVDAEVRAIYQEILGREPDPSGLAFYRNLVAPEGIAAPKGVEKMRKSLLGSAEYKQKQQQAQ